MPTEDTYWKGLLVSEFLSTLKKKQFSIHKFLSGILISNMKFRHPRLNHKNSFYLFNDQFDYALANYFAKSEITKDNINKFSTNLLIIPLTKKLSYKNTDEQIEKLLKILWGIPKDEQIEHKFGIKSDISGIA